MMDADETIDDGRMSPRVGRTKDRALAAARELLLEDGPSGVTYTEVGRRSGITRQTLYRHWPKREALLTELVVTSAEEVSFPVHGQDARTVITEFLRSMRSGLSLPVNSATLLAVAAQAHHDSESTMVVADVITDRRATLNDLLTATEVQVDSEDYAMLTGPVLLQLLFARTTVSDALIDRIVDSWAASRLSDAPTRHP